jgi:membrane-associated phospholipid phosphatase
MRRRPLVPAAWRPLAVLVWTAATLVLVALSMHFAHSSTPNRVDSAVDSRVAGRLAAHARLLSVAVRLGSPAVVVGGSMALGVLCLAARWGRGALFALVAAPAAGAIAEIVLKPAVDRTHNFDSLLFPSGHTTGAFALALTVVILLLPTQSTRLLPAVGRLLVATAALAVAGVVAVAVVVLGWHYATDAVGGAVTALTVVVAVAAVLDVTTWALSRARS